MEMSALPLAQCPAARLRECCGVFTDIDDTLTADGAIAPQALDGLFALRAAQIPVIAITGRPMGWSEGFAATWPVAAICAENGAVALIPGAAGLAVEYAQDETVRSRNAQRLREVAKRVLAEVPGATLAQDSAGRVTDMAVDHSEFAHLGDTAIAQALAIMRSEGMSASVSSIHINGWFGTHDKLSGARWMLRRLFARELDAEIARWVFVGDSTNDQAMFAAFPLSVGVANLLRFAAQLHTWPAYITQGERGVGFAEVAAKLLAARG